MATINFYVRGNKSISNIEIRFCNGTQTDIWEKTGLLINPKYWDKKRKQVKSSKQIPYSENINLKLSELKSVVLNDYIQAYTTGRNIDKEWLKSSINKHFNRVDVLEEKHFIYLTWFIEWWVQSQAPHFRGSRTQKIMNEQSVNQLINICKNIEAYQKNQRPIKFVSLKEHIDKLFSFMEAEFFYTANTIKNKVRMLNFILDRAREHNCPVPNGFKIRYTTEKKEVLEPYLNEDELDKIYLLEIEKDSLLDCVRDNLIIGCYTGLRSSDFLSRLDTDNIKQDFIEIKTKKTKTRVAIPLHYKVKEILKKRNGELPKRMSKSLFNRKIKEVCLLAGIDNVIYGGLVQNDEDSCKKKIFGNYPKYKLVSSHICRRSFATNLFGKVPNSVIMAVAGWSTEQMMLKYIKKTNMESAIELQKYYNKLEIENNEKN